ncbi:slr1659 superfamily regulator [Beggiatoa leptomitoformis]|uniref:STAS domain-containing protein n=1 Tax=Beggiatoa leptomitoformis TaxID=288004 RepID=A0A2N9YG06_9GAMM|nr:hypothetical protein [Beggiatoa leptomitoformis]ALG68276.1 hypothetical protein AL038_11850 [Beggiatoa leptomitoformis]AUI69413.1 hypothetical protein BLE401_12420 [Beggiatoa leptomitoformis]
MEIKAKDYCIRYEVDSATIVFQGILMLGGSKEYEGVLHLLRAVADNTEQLTLDLRELKMLNSSGINTLTRFIIETRDKKTPRLCMLGYEDVTWHEMLFNNLQRLMPNLEGQLVPAVSS